MTMTETELRTSGERGSNGAMTPEASDLEVEFWGPTGSGKTLLLVSLYETLLHSNQLNDFQAANEFLEIRDRVIKGLGTPVTMPAEGRSPDRQEGERFTFPIQLRDGAWRRVAIRAHAGENLTYAGSIDVPRFVRERQHKVFIACLNPFRVDEALAWKGLQHMISLLQSDRMGLNLQVAVEQAVWTLFRYEPEALRKREPLRSLLTQFDARLEYDPTRSDSENPFRWRTGNQTQAERIAAQLKALIKTRISEQAPVLNTVRQVLKHLPMSMVVLTHIDIVDALLPSITFSEIERVFESLFRDRPERMVNQQGLARPLRVEITSIFDSSADYMAGNSQVIGGGLTPLPDGLDPIQPIQGPSAVPSIAAAAPAGLPPQPRPSYEAKGVIMGQLRENGATAVLNYLKAVASFGRGSESPVVIISNLKQQIDGLKAEMVALRNKHGQLQTELETQTSIRGDLERQLEQEQKARTTTSSDYQRSLADLGDRDRRIGGLEQQLQETSARRDQLLGELTTAKARLAELEADLARYGELSHTVGDVQTALVREREQHAEMRQKHSDLRQRLSASEAEKAELQARMQSADADITHLRAEVERWMHAPGVDEAQRLKRELAVVIRERDELSEKFEQLDREHRELLARESEQRTQLEQGEAERVRSAQSAGTWQRKAEELRAQAQAEIAKRERALEELRQRIQMFEGRIARFNDELAEAQRGRLTPEEKRARDDYEMSRMGPAKFAGLLIVRALPIMPLIAALIFVLARIPAKDAVLAPLFYASSLAAFLVTVIAVLVAVGLQWKQLGPRWIWLRSFNTQDQSFEALTSTGERVTAPPHNFVLERSLLLSILGLAVIRRGDTGQRYATSEPGAWQQSSNRPAMQRLLLLDLVTVLAMGAWAAALVAVAMW